MSPDQLHSLPLAADTIAVVGMAGRFPGAPDVSAFWAANLQGNDCISRWHGEDKGEGIVFAGGLLADLELFDPDAFGLTPAEADLLDPQHRVFAESCWLALEHAAVVSSDSLLVSVYASAAPSRYRPWAPDDVNGQYRRMIANGPDFLATRISYLLDLRGEAVNVQTACSSSLVAVHLACQSLQSGRSDVALAGGVSIDPDQHLGYQYQDGMVASPDGRCRPFDQEAQGAVPGNGSAVVVLQRLDDALAQGRRVHAVIRSSAVNQDGRAKSSFMAPSVDGQADVIVSALALADVPADSVRYLEAHGTGTRIGDPIECQAATEAFRSFTDRTGFCSLGSLKGGFGHLDRAAGGAGLIKAVHVVREGVIPPLVGFKAPNPDLQLASSPFRIDTEARVLDTQSPRRAGVSAFGVGGTNAHVIVEEPPPLLRTAPEGPGVDAPLVLVASAHAPEVLHDLTRALAEHVRTRVNDATGLGSVARTLGSGRTSRPVRAAVVVRDVVQASNELRRAEFSTINPEPGRVALIFGGQGAETAYRPERLMSRYAVFREEIGRFADALRCSPQALLEGVSGRSSDLRAFAYQPSLGAVQVALARLAQDLGIKVEACCGSSVGEYAAAHMAGVLDHEALMQGLAVRAEAMARSAEGRLLSLSCSATRAQELLVPGMELAGDNAYDRALVSGPLAVVDRQLEKLARAGVRARVLPGRIAPHSALMDEAMAQVAESVSGVVPGQECMPVVSTSTGGWIRPDQLADPAHWAQHVRSPILFRQALNTLIGDGFDRFVEASPGSASTTLVNRLGHESCHAVTLGGQADGDPEETLLTAFADLWMAGVDVDWDAVNGTQGMPNAELPGYPFRRQRHWSHASAGHEAPADSGGVLGRPSWRPSAGPAGIQEGSGLPGSVTVRGGGPLGGRLMARLRAAGVAVSQTDPGPGNQPVVEPSDGSDHSTTRTGHVLIDLSQAKRPTEQLELNDVGDVRAWLGRRLLDPAKDIARSRADRVLVVTCGAQSVLPGERASAEAAGAVGLVRCLPHEQPGTGASMLDLPPLATEEEAVAAVVAELRRPADRDVALREGVRYERRYEVVRTGTSKSLRQDGTYLVLGGTGHLGAVVLDAVSREVRATLVVAGRGRITRPRGEAARLVNRARERGCTVVELELDVTDGRALTEALDDLQGTYGRVDGVFHLAAATEVVHFPLLEEGMEDQHTRVAAAKVLGAAHLSRAVADRDIDFVCLFSSLSTVIGALRFGAYVSANALLDAFAEGAGRTETGCRWTSVVWDGWAADGRAGHDALGHDDGADLLCAAMRTQFPVVTATTREVESRRDSTARDLLMVAAVAHGPAAPQDATLANVAQTVAEVTGHSSVSPEQRLAAIGVDSLQMMQIAARLRRNEPGGVRLGALLRAGSVAEMVAAIQAQAQASAPAVVRTPQDDRVTAQDALSSVQERLWFLDQLDPEGAGYHVPFGWRLPRGISLGAAREAVRTLLDRHPVLRSAYRGDYGGQVRRTELDVVSVEVLELASNAPEEVVRSQIERPLDLSQGSTRVLLRNSSPVEIIFVCHHISVDAWSVRLLHEDLARVLHGEALDLPIGRYADFVQWERERRQDPDFAASLGFWRNVLHEVSAQPPPPDDGAELAEPLGPAARTTLLVPQSVLAPLRERLVDEGATLFAAGLTGLSLALGTWSHRATSVLGTNMANRHTPQVEGVVGMFVDPVVLVLRPTEVAEGLATTGSALAQVRRTLVEAMSHADVPYADIVEAVARNRSNPLISVIVTMFDAEQGVSRDLVPLELPNSGSAKFPLAVEFLPKPEGLLLHALYARNLYRRATVDRALARTARYLQVLAERGLHIPLSELENPHISAQQRFAHRFGGPGISPAGPDEGTVP